MVECFGRLTRSVSLVTVLDDPFRWLRTITQHRNIRDE
jgi:hypothetical protein